MINKKLRTQENRIREMGEGHLSTTDGVKLDWYGGAIYHEATDESQQFGTPFLLG